MDYLPLAIYPSASLGWMMYIGMADIDRYSSWLRCQPYCLRRFRKLDWCRHGQYGRDLWRIGWSWYHIGDVHKGRMKIFLAKTNSLKNIFYFRVSRSKYED